MNRELIIVFANQQYREVLQNWLVAVRRLGIANYCVIALDRTLARNLRKEDTPVKYWPCRPGLGHLWVHRVKVIRRLLVEGHDVIHSDADAVWLEDPRPQLASLPQDLLFSQGTIWPKDVHEVWKFVLCSGFFMARSNSRTLNFFKELQRRVRKDKDDQRSCNRMLLESGMRWDLPTESYELSYNGQAFDCYHSPVIGYNDDLSVALLPHSAIQRIPDPRQSPCVMHIISEKTSESCRDVMQQNGCWFL